MAVAQNSTTNDRPRTTAIAGVRRVIEIAIRTLEVILGTLFLVAVASNFLNAVGRYVFNKTILGADEVQIYIMVWVTFVGAATVTWRHRHLRMDALLVRFPTSVRLAIYAIELVLVAGLTALLTWESSRYTALMSAIDRRSDLAGLPMWIPHIALAIGFGLIALITAWQMIELAVTHEAPKSHPVGSDI